MQVRICAQRACQTKAESTEGKYITLFERIEKEHRKAEEGKQLLIEASDGITRHRVCLESKNETFWWSVLCSIAGRESGVSSEAVILSGSPNAQVIVVCFPTFKGR